MSFEVFSGPPVGITAPGAAVTEGIDTANDIVYISDGVNGWTPMSLAAAKGSSLAQTSTVANLLTFAVPRTGLYSVTTYTAQATATNGTLPVPTVTFTEGDTGTVGATATTVASGTATTGAGQSQSGSVAVFAKGNTNIVVSVAAPTTLTYNAKARVAFLG